MKKLTACLLTTAYCLLPTSVFAATLSVSPTVGTFAPSCAFSVDIKLDTQGAKTDGVDAIIFYDSSKLSAKQIRNGTLYTDYPQTIIDPANNKIIISGSASAASPYQGAGTFASVDFTVDPTATAGLTKLSFDFDPADKTKTTDSNVAERNNLSDVLSGVTGGSYTIGTGSCGASGGPGGAVASGSGTLQGGVETKIPVKTLPVAGDFNTTLILGIGGGILTILGILGLALL